MTEHRGRSEFESRLPDDPAYWSALADRITRTAEPVFAELDGRPVWWRPLDRLAPALGIGALAAAVATFVVLPAPPVEPPPSAVATALDPTGLLESAFTTAPAPDMMSLLVSEEAP